MSSLQFFRRKWNSSDSPLDSELLKNQTVSGKGKLSPVADEAWVLGCEPTLHPAVKASLHATETADHQILWVFSKNAIVIPEEGTAESWCKLRL